MNKSKCTIETDQTTPASESHANSWGLMEMSGNVFEWCKDDWDEDFYSKPEATRKNPVCESGSEFRVFRGGAFRYVARCARSAYRYFDSPGFRFPYLGFRAAKVIT